MNYRHAFHAGNFGDVLKHIVLALVIEHLKAKETAFRVIDTHAGIGRYDLAGDEARRGGEWPDGIGRIVDATPPADVAALIAPWLDVVRAENRNGPLVTFPGSPLLARRLLRPQDRMTAIELHPDDGAALAALFAGDRRVTVRIADGWAALKAVLPPPERRGIVLVDPAFEVAGELPRLGEALVRAWRRWPTGTLVGWYPIKGRAPVDALHAHLADSPIDKLVAADLFVRDPESTGRLPGAGLVVVNPPWTLADALDRLMPWLADTLAQGPGAGFRVRHLKAA